MTSQAALEDVIDKGTVSLQFPIGPEDVMAYSGQEHGVKLASMPDPARNKQALLLNLTNVAGRKSYWKEVSIFPRILILNLNSKTACNMPGLALQPTRTPRITIKSTENKIEVGEIWTITRLKLKPIYFSVGVIPVVLQPMLSLKLGSREM